MNLEQVKLLFSYDTWGNEAIFDAVSALAEDTLRKDLGSSHRSIFGTLVHIVAAEDIWLARWKGQPNPKLVQEAEFSSLGSLQDFWRQVRRARDSFIDTLTEQTLIEEIRITTTSGEEYRHPYWQMFQHLANHSSYHRGQIASMLRQLGVPPPATDLIRFYRQRARPT